MHGNADALLESLEPKVTDTVQKLRRNTTLRILLNVKLQPDPWSNRGKRHAQLEDSDIKPIVELKESSSTRPAWQDF